MKIPPIGEFMTPNPLTVSAEQSVRRAKVLMSTHGIRHLPVVSGGEHELFGVISDRDIKLAQAVSRADDFDDKCLIRDLCQTEPYVVQVTAPADQVLDHLHRRKIGSALVVHEGRLVGIFTVTDACRAFAAFLKKTCAQAGTEDGKSAT